MIVLEYNRNFFQDIYLLPSGKRPTLFQYVKIGVLASMEIFLVVPAIVYFIQNIRNLRNATESMYAITSFSISFGMYCYFLANQTALVNVLNELQEIVNWRFGRSYFKTYEAMEAKITKFARSFTTCIYCMCSIVMLMPFVVVGIFLLKGDLRRDLFFCPFKVTFPFDINTIGGFLTGNVIQSVVCWKFNATFCAFNTFFIGVCWYICVCVDDIQTIFDEIESHLASTSTKDNPDHCESNLTKFALKRSLLEAVKLHNKILRFVENFASLMDGVIFLTFSIGTIWLSTSLAQYMHFDLKLFQPTVSNTLICVWLFVYCFFGHLISSKCVQVGEYVYNSKFYYYPLDLRIFTLFMILRSQRPFFITGYRITKCSLESYARFMNTAMSFYMLFRNLAK